MKDYRYKVSHPYRKRDDKDWGTRREGDAGSLVLTEESLQ